MRGKPEQAFMLFVTVRITPADAGKTRLCGSLSARPEDHPRGCGENFQPHHIAAFRAGSPPQVRGKQCIITRQRREGRITPAGAGKTNRWTKLHKETVDHPRRCGENLLPLLRLWSPLGSPPQVRGKLYVGVVCVGDWGITPAGAGKTQSRRLTQPAKRDHPRRCGENCLGALVPAVGTGSPPQVRGKPMVILPIPS